MILEEIAQKVRSGKVKDTKALVQQAIDEGIPAQEILEQGLVAGMNVIGELFKNNEVFVPEVLIAARAMNQGAQLLKPLLLEEGVQASGKVCIGTVQGDLHDIGKNLVKMMLEGKGLEVIDLGTDVAPETFVETAKAEDCWKRQTVLRRILSCQQAASDTTTLAPWAWAECTEQSPPTRPWSCVEPTGKETEHGPY